MALPAVSYLDQNTRTEGEMKVAFEDQLKGIKQIPGAGIAEQALTLATDTITPALGAGGAIAVDTEAAAGTDNLATIAQTNTPDGTLLLLGLANAAHVVTVKHLAGGTGQISLRSGADLVMSLTTQWLMVKRTGTLWEEIFRSGAENLINPIITTGTVAADPTTNLGIVSKQYADALSKVQEFRLSLTTAVPVTTADVIGAGTLYAVPYIGNHLALYDGTRWVVRSSAQFSLALTLTASKPYDIFCFDNAGVPTLEALVWTNDTTRATALVYQDGVLVKSGDALRRYMGTLYSSGANTTEDSFVKRYLWNYYHRKVRVGRNKFSTNRTTTSNTYVEINSEIRVQFIIGVAEDAVFASANGGGNTGNYIGTAVAFDGAIENGLEGFGLGVGSTGSGLKLNLTAGFHYATLFGGCSTGTTTWLQNSSFAGTPGPAAYVFVMLLG